MHRIFLILGGAFAALAVMTGALGAHALKKKASEGLITSDQLLSFETAVKYQMYHALALILVFVIIQKYDLRAFHSAGILFTIGIVFFSGSIYVLSLKTLLGLSDVGFLGPVTPIGGLLLISGWITLIYGAFKLPS
jgi:uncharacterized membrane protein YgdD (TMEM256/DUF423 family)